MDLREPLADLDALRAEAREEHDRGVEWATVALRLMEALGAEQARGAVLRDDYVALTARLRANPVERIAESLESIADSFKSLTAFAQRTADALQELNDTGVITYPQRDQ